MPAAAGGGRGWGVRGSRGGAGGRWLWRPADAFVRGEDACLQLQVGGGGLGGLVYVSLAGSLTLMMLTSGCTWVQSVVLPGGGHLTVCK